MSLRALLTRDIGPAKTSGLARAFESAGLHLCMAALFIAGAMLLLPAGEDSLWHVTLGGGGAVAWVDSPPGPATMLALLLLLYAVLATFTSAYRLGRYVIRWREAVDGFAAVATLGAAALVGLAAVFPAVIAAIAVSDELVPGSALQERAAFALQLFTALAPLAVVLFWSAIIMLTHATRKEGLIDRRLAPAGVGMSALAALAPLAGAPANLMLAGCAWLLVLGALLTHRQLRSWPESQTAPERDGARVVA
jgi:hypothetical protein